MKIELTEGELVALDQLLKEVEVQDFWEYNVDQKFLEDLFPALQVIRKAAEKLK